LVALEEAGNFFKYVWMFPFQYFYHSIIFIWIIFRFMAWQPQRIWLLKFCAKACSNWSTHWPKVHVLRIFFFQFLAFLYLLRSWSDELQILVPRILGVFKFPHLH
jgi:hypothetical protein